MLGEGEDDLSLGSNWSKMSADELDSGSEVERLIKEKETKLMKDAWNIPVATLDRARYLVDHMDSDLNARVHHAESTVVHYFHLMWLEFVL